MAQVLALYSSLTHQTERIVLTVAEALTRGGHTVHCEKLEAVEPMSLPVPPEQLASLLGKALQGTWPVVPMKPLRAPLETPYTLILLGYQPWYMTPSVPMHSFLKSPDAQVLRGRPVIGLLSCRALYARASRRFERWVSEAGGSVLEQRVWTDQDKRPTNFASLGHMLKHGVDPQSGPLKQLLKPFGIGETGLARAQSYGESLATRLKLGLLDGGGGVRVMS